MDARASVSHSTASPPRRRPSPLAERAVEAGAHSLWVAEHLGYREAIATCVAFALKAPGPCWCRPPSVRISGTRRRPRWRWRRSTSSRRARSRSRVGVGNPLFLQESGQSRRKADPRDARVHRSAAQALEQRARAHGWRVRPLAGAGWHSSQAPIPIYIAAMGPDMLQLPAASATASCCRRPCRRNSVKAVARAVRGRRREAGPRHDRLPARRIPVLRHLAQCAVRRSTRCGRSSPS